ncbi:MAG TPA: restriction endonuclease [Kofleriaceae bacterium]|nr:restriction endonuclease [Kofleriaceae bacterium]
MAKKKSSGDAEGDAEATKTKKKTAAKKPAAKKAAAPKKSRSKKKDADESENAVVDTAPEVADVIEAEIIAETPASAMADSTDENDAVEPPTALSEEEQELSAIYGDDLTKPATAHREFQDNKTRDEDRPMMPEINARDERKARWEDRRERRRRERDERRARREGGHPGQRPPQEQRDGQGRDGQSRDGQSRDHRDNREPRPQGEPRPPQQFQQAAPQPPRPSAPQINGHEHDQLARVGTPLGDAASAVFQQLRNGQPLPVRQLAAMMRKRSLVNQDPEQLWPQLKAELLGDERSYRTLGLRPRIVYRGRDLFSPGPVSMSATADAEAGLASALSKLASATHRALSQRLAKASPAGFERIIHAYLVAAGYRDIDWVKRIGGISYATAIAPGLDRTVLISARSGSEPIDRRGVGELRVGVEAKDLVTGILITPGELSEDAERELERAGRSISVVCGDQLVAALIQAGVGVVSAAAPLHYLDDQLLEELLAG